jgi:hypothetical protein
MQDQEVSPPVQTMSDDDYVKFKNDLGLAPVDTSGSWSQLSGRTKCMEMRT